MIRASFGTLLHSLHHSRKQWNSWKIPVKQLCCLPYMLWSLTSWERRRSNIFICSKNYCWPEYWQESMLACILESTLHMLCSQKEHSLYHANDFPNDCERFKPFLHLYTSLTVTDQMQGKAPSGFSLDQSDAFTVNLYESAISKRGIVWRIFTVKRTPFLVLEIARQGSTFREKGSYLFWH